MSDVGWESKEAQLRQEIRELRDENTRLAGQNAVLRGEVARLTAEHRRRVAERDYAESECARLTVALQAAIKELAHESATCEDWWHRSEAAESEVARLTATLRTVTEAGQQQARERDAAVARAETDRLRDVFGAFQAEVGRWADETFKVRGYHDVAGAATHLVMESGEVKEAVDLDQLDRVPEETADCLLLLVTIAHRQGYSLMEAARAKFDVLAASEWGLPDENGVYHRIKPAASPAEKE